MEVLLLKLWKIRSISTPSFIITSCVSRLFVTGLFSLFVNVMCRNWLFGMSLMNIHLICEKVHR